jgi:hypothetical protein
MDRDAPPISLGREGRNNSICLDHHGIAFPQGSSSNSCFTNPSLPCSLNDQRGTKKILRSFRYY